MVQQHSPKEKELSETEKERIDNEAHLQRLRELIKEDRKAKAKKAEIEGSRIEASASLLPPSLIPLVVSQSTEEEGPSSANAEEITLKIVYNTEERIMCLNRVSTIESFKKLIETQFKVKRFKAYTPSRGEISLASGKSTLPEEGIQSMDVIHILKE
ncbi:hypothetical protein NECID01_0061 [Nematocida sp. AWRm77]|nr:hypothetical protein NECID01_0061 [Nematocida sp. AWRm77]